MINVIPDSYSFCLFNFVTLMFVYAKIEDNFYIDWEYVFIPTILFCLLRFF